MIPQDLKQALSDFAKHPHILIALDFDGTLAPLVDDPTHSRMIPEARKALEALDVIPGVTIALVTGRAIESITVVGEPLPNWYLVGSHGIEFVAPSDRATYSTPRLVPDELIHGFEQIVGQHPGSRIEVKPFGVALHTRGVPEPIATSAEAAAHSFCEGWGEAIVVRLGHGIVECTVKDATKGDGIALVRAAVAPDAVFFAGDDFTDEDGFAVMRDSDVAVRVGGGDTIAPYRLDDAYSVAEALWFVHELRVGTRS